MTCPGSCSSTPSSSSTRASSSSWQSLARATRTLRSRSIGRAASASGWTAYRLDALDPGRCARGTCGASADRCRRGPLRLRRGGTDPRDCASNQAEACARSPRCAHRTSRSCIPAGHAPPHARPACVRGVRAAVRPGGRRAAGVAPVRHVGARAAAPACPRLAPDASRRAAAVVVPGPRRVGRRRRHCRSRPARGTQEPPPRGPRLAAAAASGRCFAKPDEQAERGNDAYAARLRATSEAVERVDRWIRGATRRRTAYTRGRGPRRWTELALRRRRPRAPRGRWLREPRGGGGSAAIEPRRAARHRRTARCDAGHARTTRRRDRGSDAATGRRCCARPAACCSRRCTRLHGLRFAHVFVGGLTEGEFPAPRRTGAFLDRRGRAVLHRWRARAATRAAGCRGRAVGHGVLARGHEHVVVAATLRRARPAARHFLVLAGRRIAGSG